MSFKKIEKLNLFLFSFYLVGSHKRFSRLQSHQKIYRHIIAANNNKTDYDSNFRCRDKLKLRARNHARKEKETTIIIVK